MPGAEHNCVVVKRNELLDLVKWIMWHPADGHAIGSLCVGDRWWISIPPL